MHQHGGLVQVRLRPAVLGWRRHRLDAVDGARRGHQLRGSVRHSTIGAAVGTLAPRPPASPALATAALAATAVDAAFDTAAAVHAATPRRSHVSCNLVRSGHGGGPNY